MSETDGEFGRCAQILRNFLDGERRFKQLPARQKMKMCAYCWLALQLDGDHTYTEPELNGAIGRRVACSAPATLRRELVDFGFTQRKPDGSAYWLVESGQWTGNREAPATTSIHTSSLAQPERR